jgi:hypothetical protein
MPVKSVMRNFSIISVAVMAILALSIPVSADIIFKEYYEGLPDYGKTSPFTVHDKSIHQELQRKLRGLEAGKDECVVGSVDGAGYNIKSNICDSVKLESIKSTLLKMAPSLNPDHLTAWMIDADGGAGIELLVGHVDIKTLPEYPELRDAYLSLWLLVEKGEFYEDVYAGPFLMGEFHGSRSFGPKRDRKAVFIRYPSCTECEPWIYLTPVDFLAGTEGAAFQFSYSKDHDSFSPTIEYGLPGLGHSIDASLKTRIPKYIDAGPNLMQFFDVEEGDDEWWIFTCDGMKCDYEMFLNDLPSHLKAIWENAEEL